MDANLLIAFCVRGRHVLLAAAERGACRLFVCPYVVREAERMLHHAFPARARELDEFLAELPLDQVPDAGPEALARWKGYLSDRADVPVLAAAIEAGLDCLVTSDRTFRADARATLAADGDPIYVLSVTEFLRLLDTSPSE